MPLQTELTRKLGIRVPIVQGGMHWVGYAELASAVSNAGALGILTSLTQPTPEDLRNEIRRLRTMTDKPFGVNLTCLPTINPPPYAEYARVIVEEGVKIVETAGLVEQYVPTFKAAGCTVLHKCTSIRHALSAEKKMDVDFLSIDGFECAGHVGESDIPGLILLSRARQQLRTPFIGSGGFADAQGLVAALALGACGVNMGTRFLCTVEAPVHWNIKEAIVRAQETDTQLVLRRWKNTSRYFRNKVSEAAYEVEKSSQTGDFKEVQQYVSGQRGRQAFLNGDPDYGVWSAGMCVGLINDIPTCHDLVHRIEREAYETYNNVGTVFKTESRL